MAIGILFLSTECLRFTTVRYVPTVQSTVQSTVQYSYIPILLSELLKKLGEMEAFFIYVICGLVQYCITVNNLKCAFTPGFPVFLCILISFYDKSNKSVMVQWLGQLALTQQARVRFPVTEDPFGEHDSAFYLKARIYEKS